MNIPSSTFASLALTSSPLRDRMFIDFTTLEQEIYLASRCNLCTSPEAAISLIRSVQYIIRRGLPGALVECEVWYGGSIEIMIRTLQHLGTEREIYLYDTFSGMPKPEAVDDPTGELLRLWRSGDWMSVDEGTVTARLAPLGYPMHLLRLVKGKVEETLPAIRPEKVALLRLDTDFYSSTRHELIHLYPLLVSGGALIIDDYGAMPGCRKAVDEYSAGQWLLGRVDAHVRLMVKEKE